MVRELKKGFKYMAGADVLERKVIHAGKVFIKAGEENNRAYVIQQGKVSAFIVKEGEKIEVAEYGPGTIIGEVCLVLDDPIKMSFEAIVSTTVVTITRQDFEKKMNRVDKTVKTIFNQVISKLFERDSVLIGQAGEDAKIDDDAVQLVQALISNLPPDKKFQYEKAILPHLNGLIKEIKGLKKTKRHQDQGNAVEEKVAEVKGK